MCLVMSQTTIYRACIPKTCNGKDPLFRKTPSIIEISVRIQHETLQFISNPFCTMIFSLLSLLGDLSCGCSVLFQLRIIGRYLNEGLIESGPVVSGAEAQGDCGWLPRFSRSGQGYRYQPRRRALPRWRHCHAPLQGRTPVISYL